MLNSLLPFKDMMIDIDDSGPLEPFKTRCNFQGSWRSASFALSEVLTSDQSIVSFRSFGRQIKNYFYKFIIRRETNSVVSDILVPEIKLYF